MLVAGRKSHLQGDEGVPYLVEFTPSTASTGQECTCVQSESVRGGGGEDHKFKVIFLLHSELLLIIGDLRP